MVKIYMGVSLLVKIGIPRGLFYYIYYPFWKVFFEKLGFEVIISSKTNREIMENGLKNCVDDACLPVKVFHGHILDLSNKCDVLYIPRIISTNKKEYICPKFMGLPDMIKNTFDLEMPVIDEKLDLYKSNRAFYQHFFNIGQKLGKAKKEIIKAFYYALYYYYCYKKKLKKYQILPLEEEGLDLYQNVVNYRSKEKEIVQSKYKVLLLGHPYNIYDDYISMSLIKKLKNYNIKIITPEIIKKENNLRETLSLNKKLFWTIERNIIESAILTLRNKEIDGIIYVASFGCGPDSIVGELVKMKIGEDYNIPYLQLYIDEHSGQAGFDTRLEAFVDILERRRVYK